MAAAASAPSGAWSVASRTWGSWKLVIPLTERSSSSQRQAELSNTPVAAAVIGSVHHSPLNRSNRRSLAPPTWTVPTTCGRWRSNQRNFAGQ